MESKKTTGFGRKALGSLSALALAIGMVAGSAAPAMAAEFKMAIAHIWPEDMENEVHPALIHFKSIVEAETDGAVEVEIYGNQQLGSEVETGKQAQNGKLLQSTVISSGAMSSFYKNYQIVTSPFLFPNFQVAHAFFDGPWFRDFMKGSIEESGLRYLGTYDDGGGFVAFTSKKLIRTADDIKGLKIRVEENPAHVAVMRSLGASATPLPWGEVVTALGTGLADGQFNAPGVSKFFKLWEVNDYTTLSRHIYNTQTWLVSDKWMSTLPDNYKEIIIQAAREAVGISHGIAALQAIVGWEVSCKEFKECYVLPADERQKMADIARPAWKNWIVNDFGIQEEKVDALWAEVDRLTKEIGASNDAYGG
ncbi:MAG: TRAP transporter substrate-binding protein DctP [Castellaniella sp.]